MLDVGDGHSLYVQDWGNKSAVTPIISLHGGPGSNASDKQKISFDPKVHRVIFFDQRGCGLSQPFTCLENNDTWKQIADISKIADHLKIEKFTITGASWGSCLALVYAINNPGRVVNMVLMGIFTGTKNEVDWIAKGGYKNFFPDVWEKFLDNTPLEDHEEADKYHFDRILGDDMESSIKSSVVLSDTELSIMSLDDRYMPFSEDGYDNSHARMETHYLSNNCFLEDNYILNNSDKLTMPIWFIQGRYDMVCPPINAWNLHKQIPSSKLTFTMAGHDFARSTYDTYSTILANLQSK